MQAWHDCLPMQQADWIGSECGRVFLRGMALDWLAENGRGGREWLCAAGMGLDAWHQAAAHAEAMITLPRGQWKMGVAQGLPVIRPTMGAGEQEEEADEPVARLGMRQWEDVISRITEEEIDDLVRQAVRVTRQDIAERVDERDRHLDIPLAMSVASVALMGLANAGWYAILQGQPYTAMPGQSGTAMPAPDSFCP